MFRYVLAECNLTPREPTNLSFVSTFHSLSSFFAVILWVHACRWAQRVRLMFQPRTGICRAGGLWKWAWESRLEEQRWVMGSRPAQQSGSYEAEGSGLLRDVRALGESFSDRTCTVPSGNSSLMNLSNWSEMETLKLFDRFKIILLWSFLSILQ